MLGKKGQTFSFFSLGDSSHTTLHTHAQVTRGFRGLMVSKTSAFTTIQRWRPRATIHHTALLATVTLPAMGSCLSSLRVQENDWMYIEAIRKPQYLDWRQHIVNEEERRQVVQAQNRPPLQIMEDVFLSGATGMLDTQRLKQLGITHVLNAAGKQGTTTLDASFSCDHMIYKVIEASDRQGYAMLEYHLEECREFIASCRSQGGKCVVHCQAGANRSGVIVAAEMMLTQQKALLDVVYHCRKQRGNTFLCNQSFIEELVALARTENLLGPPPGTPGCIVQSRIPRPN